MANACDTVETSENVSAEHCHFFITRKNRYCKMTIRKGHMFCGEHKDHDPKKDHSLIRIPCPLDSKHTCYVHLLENHMNKCNAGKLTLPDYVIKGVNRGRCSCDDTTKLTLSSVDSEVVGNLIGRLKNAGIPLIDTEEYSHPILAAELSNSKYGASTRKQLHQNSSLLGHLFKLGVMAPGTCFVEFGAGRGQLSYWIGEAMSQMGISCSMVLIDRANNRHKFDSRHRSHDLVDIHRLHVDIADVSLGRVPIVKNSKSVVAICKHLCGDATDLALRCIASSNLNNITGVVMAPCCHHKLKWYNYVDKIFLQKKDFTKQDFQILSSLASWATSGDLSATQKKVSQRVESKCAEMNISPGEREEIGRRCKILFDFGRRRFLKKIGFHCKMVYYTERDVSPENVCLIATNMQFAKFLNVDLQNMC